MLGWLSSIPSFTRPSYLWYECYPFYRVRSLIRPKCENCDTKNHACFAPKPELLENPKAQPRCNYCRRSKKGCKFPDAIDADAGSSPVKGSSGGSKESTVGKSGEQAGTKRKAPPASAAVVGEGRSVKSRTGAVSVPIKPVVMLPPSRGRAQLPSAGSSSSYPSPRFGLGELPFGSASSSRLSVASIPEG